MAEVWCATAVEDNRIYATAFGSDEHTVMKHLLQSLPYNRPFQMVDETTRLAEKVLRTLESLYIGSDPKIPSFELEMEHLSNYARRILTALSKVPVGYVTTYGALAKAAGGSPRAVGRIMATNPFPLLIPCHRVVRSDFTMGGFGLGIKVKAELLQREDRKYADSMETDAGVGTLSLFPVKCVQQK